MNPENQNQQQQAPTVNPSPVSYNSQAFTSDPQAGKTFAIISLMFSALAFCGLIIMGLPILFGLIGVTIGAVAYIRAKTARANTLLPLLGIAFNAVIALCDLLFILFFVILFGVLGN